MINVKVELQLDEKVVSGKVKHRLLAPEDNMAGRYDANPMLNSMIYEGEFPDGQVKDYAANVITENMISQIYDKGYSVTLIDSIVYYKRDDSEVDKNDKYFSLE